MAQVFKVALEEYYIGKLEKLENNLKVEQEYSEIYKNKLHQKAANKLHKLKLDNQSKLIPYEIKLGDVKEYYENEYRKAYQSIYFKIMLLKKKETQKYLCNEKKNVSYAYNMHLEALKSINEKEKKLALKLHEKYENLIKRDTLDEEALKLLKIEYNNLKISLQNKYVIFENELKISIDKKFIKYEQKMEKRIASLNKRIKKYRTKLDGVKKVYDKELEKGVVLQLEHVSMHFGGLKAVNDLSFKVYDGDIFGLIGPNGAGKTTVFNCITQFYKMTHGEAWYMNNENVLVKLNDLKVHNVVKHGIIRTFQNVELAWELSILDNLKVAGHSLYKSSLFDQVLQTRKYKKEEEIVTKKALDVLEYLGLLAYKDIPPLGLPYGILKRIELARTLMANPKVIILDEPAAGLNDKETKELSELLIKIKKDYHVTIFLVEHDMGMVMNICNRICAISFGQLLAIGTPTEIQNNKAVQEAYLGGE